MSGESSSGQERDEPSVEFIEIDPSGRFGRYQDVLGKGAVKTVYKAFDELEGIEVAWNQVKVVDLQRNSVDLERLYSEVHLLKTLKHTNIIKFYSSWIDPMKDNVNFITEVFTSGTLRQYRKKHKQVDIRALKNWSRQILRGLCYLHSHDPPVIHRDLKCDNIFVNGNHGEIKIGDLGSAAILRYAHSARSVIGTPEFMAPELYEEDYNELVDIYAFGMCLLELVTFQYPYLECNNAAQIYKKVTSGIKPAALAEVKDPEIKEFIEKCIADVSKRLSARELLLDSFLHSDAENGSINYSVRSSSPVHPESGTVGLDFSVQGQRQDMNTMFLKLQIPDSTGQIRNIHFPFDIEEDTSVCVATEMVAELDLTDQDVTAIAAMIDAEIKAYVPDWKPEEFSDSDGPENEAAEEASASPASSVHHQSVGVFLSDSREVTSGDSPSPPQLDSDKDSSIEDCESEDDSFNNDTHKDWRSNGSSMPKQHSDSPHQSESGDDEQDFASSTELTNSGGSSPSHRSNQDHESPPGSVSQLCGRGANSELHGGEDKHLHESLSLQVDVSIDFQPIIQKLENLLIEQRKEVDEIQREHNSAIAELLKGLTAEKHSEMLHTCRSKVKKMKEQTHT